MVSVRDVAAAAGVSQSTVSNALNRPHRVSEAKRKRVEDAIASLGYVRNEIARHLRAGAGKTIALILLDAWNPFFNEVARGVEDAASASGRKVLVANSARQPEREDELIKLFEEQRVGGIVIVPTGNITDRLKAAAQKGILSVVVSSNVTSEQQLTVKLDDVAGGRLAAEHLLSRGHTAIAIVGDPETVDEVSDRFRGFNQAIEEWTQPVTVIPVKPSSMTIAEGEIVGEKLLQIAKDRRPTAVFATNDLLALGILHRFAREGVQIPRDIAIIGYDDIEFARQAIVPLSSIVQPAYDMGVSAAEALIQAIDDDDDVEHHVIFQPRLVARDSTSSSFR